MTAPLALIVDDEPDIRELLEITLGRMDVATLSAPDLAQARRLLESHRFDLCLTDMRLPDGNGIELVAQIGEKYPTMPVAMITAHGNMESAIQALKAGAFDFVNKPVDLRILRELVSSALNMAHGRPEGQPSAGLVGHSPTIERLRLLIAKLARSQAPVYIGGESGTGKELAARMIHDQGPRANAPFVAVNCGAIPQELMESEFFGHRRGSFTGAVADKAGLFQAAAGGTLFLDEVADLPVAMQVKLLRAIQEKRVRPVGAQDEEHVDVRILSATHQNLADLVKQGTFRQDLYYRINVIEMWIPPLRDRREDIPLLANHILDRLAQDTGTSRVAIDEAAMSRLQQYEFPGNVRELENLLERASTLCEAGCIRSSDVQVPANAPVPPAVSASIDRPLEDYLDEIEKQAILQALEQTRWNRTEAARRLGISFRALRYRLSKLGLDQSD
jgi:two-component system response regulator PilR (NtrC family)